MHGGRLADACERFGGAREDWLDLSTGLNPNAWPGVQGISIDWNALPDPCDLARLEQRAARYFDVDPGLCCAVPGSETGLRLVARILGLPGLHRPLTYGTHADAFEQARPFDPAEQAPPGASALVIANPNNPDGRVTRREALEDMLAAQERQGGWLIVDEAFADCRPEWSMADRVTERRRLIVLRSFGKFFGLAGVRLGFVLAPSALIVRVRRLLGDWPVCAAGLAFGAAAYDDDEWIADTRRDLVSRAARLDEVLARNGLLSSGECPLFRLVETDAAGPLFELLAQQHILTRPFAGHPRLLRFGLPGDDAALARFGAALAKALSLA
jgi:cobalamin biosynthetic protein CobC